MQYQILSAFDLPSLARYVEDAMNNHGHWRPVGSIVIEPGADGVNIYHQAMMSAIRAVTVEESPDPRTDVTGSTQP